MSVNLYRAGTANLAAAEAAIRRLNGSDDIDCLTLYPGQEYALFTWTQAMEYAAETGHPMGDARFYPVTSSYYATNYRLDYRWADHLSYDRLEAPFPLRLWEDVENDPALPSSDYAFGTVHPCYNRDNHGFFFQREYEIVDIYG